jgi:hypothetical protein
MPTVAEIHLREANIGGWMVFIEGIAEAWTNVPALVGGASGWIGSAWGARYVKLGLVMPGSLPFGETDPWLGSIRSAQTVAFTLVDLDGDDPIGTPLVQLFSDQPDPLTTYTLGQRLSPLDDPAPEPAVGLGGDFISIWDTHVGIERIGPDGERRWFWIAPDDVPPGLDHPAPIDWPPTQSTYTPAAWAGRKIAVYRIVKDPDTGLWPEWDAQYEGGSLWWFGTMTDNGRWTDSAGDATTKGRAFTFYAQGPASWTERSLNLSRPTKWLTPEHGVSLSGDELLVAAWIEPIGGEPYGGGISYAPTFFDAQTFLSGNTFAGLTSRSELAAKLYDIVRAMVDGGTYNGVDGTATNAAWTGGGSLGTWNQGDVDTINCKVRIGDDGSLVEIRCHDAMPGRVGFNVGIAIDVRIWQLFGWDTTSIHFSEPNQNGGELPVGGPNWGEAEGDQVLPEFHKIGYFSTRRNGVSDLPENQWDNNGDWQSYQAEYQVGTVTLDNDGPTEVFLTIGVAATEGQHGNPFTLGAQIDGTDVDASGWWVFKGRRLLAADFESGNLEGTEYMGVALCEWVSTSDGTGVEENSDGYAVIRIIKWEDPREFGLPFDPLEEPWTNVIGGLECAPLGVFGGIVDNAPGFRNLMIPAMLLSSGTAVWDDSGEAVTITPGVNHPADIPMGFPYPGDIEVADMGCGLPAVFVDWASWAANNSGVGSTLTGGISGALNRVRYVVSGSVKASTIMREAMAGAGWGWICAREVGGKVPRFAAYDPLRPLSPADAVATLTRALMAEPTISDSEPQWRGKIELRRGGPYDRFKVEVGGNPLGGGGDLYSQTYESLDPQRRSRSGRIEWGVVDSGLRDPTPWVGFEKKVLFDWTEHARQRFATGFGQRLAAQLRIYRADYQALVVPLLGLGSVVRVIDSTAESSDGTRGIDHMGRVCQYEILSRGDGNCVARVAVELERTPVSAVHVWGPYAYSAVGEWDADTSLLTLSEDIATVGGDHADTTGWERPAWCTVTAGQLRLLIVQSEDGETALAGLVTADLVDVDEGDLTLELDNITGTLYRDTVKWVFAAPLDDAGQVAAWALAIFAPVTTPGGTWDGGTLGTRLK